MTKITIVTCDTCKKEMDKGMMWIVSYKSSLLELNQSLYFCDADHMMEYLDKAIKRKDA